MHFLWQIGFVLGFLLACCESFSTSKSNQSKEAPKFDPGTQRRRFLQQVGSLVGGFAGMTLHTNTAMAAIDISALQPVEMKSFVDPQGLFTVNVPKRFFSIRRSAKGDLPNDRGQGRRGSSIFTAGDMSKAEVIAVERFPTGVLLEENGVQPSGALSTVQDIGNPGVVAELIAVRRDREKGGESKTKVVKDSISVSPDGKELSFVLRTQIEVQKPELLLEQTGVSELFRVTTAKASLQSDDGNMLAVFASALEADWKTEDGVALQAAVDSFKSLRPPTAQV